MNMWNPIEDSVPLNHNDFDYGVGNENSIRNKVTNLSVVAFDMFPLSNKLVAAYTGET